MRWCYPIWIVRHTAYKISDDAVVALVRPDGHIAYCDRADRLDLTDVYSSWVLV